MSDALRAVRAGSAARFTGFLSERECRLALVQLNRENWTEYVFDGGFQGAERRMLCVFEDKTDPSFPLGYVKIELPSAEPVPAHRDYLGAILGCGIRRECAGDILMLPDGAVAVLQDTVIDHVLRQLAGVGRHEVRMSRVSAMPGQAAGGIGRTKTASVASLRLDAVLAAALDKSRERAADLIEAERVQVNHRVVARPHYLVGEGDVLSVRGVGRVELSELGGRSRKGRIRITCTLY